MLYSSSDRDVLNDLAGFPQILQHCLALAIGVLAITSLFFASDNRNTP
jgi:hypothetical protein